MTTQVERPTLTYHRARVTAVRSVTPQMVRVTFEAAGFREVPPGAPDQYVKAFFPLAGQEEPRLPETGSDIMSWYRTYLAMPDDVRPPMRTYTVRAHRPEAAEIDVDFALHGDTGRLRRGRPARPGGRPRRVPRPARPVRRARRHRLAAAGRRRNGVARDRRDHRAAPGRHARFRRTSRCPERGERQTFETRGAVEVHWLIRGSRPLGEALLDAVRAASFPGGAPYAWVSGEAGVVKLVRRHLVREREVDKRRICFTGYWRLGISEEDASREAVRAAEAGEVPSD